MDELSWIRYWRNSIADAESGKGAIKVKELKKLHSTKRTDFPLGSLIENKSTLNTLFDNEDNKTVVIKAHYRPVVYSIKKEHGKDFRGTLPQILCPIICPIWVTREGLFFPAGSPYIPRDILAPQADDKFFISKVTELDDFLTVNTTHSYSDEEIFSVVQKKEIIETQIDTWQLYYKFTQKLFKDVCKKEKINEFYTLTDNGYIGKIDEIQGGSSNILTLYDKLSEARCSLPLLKNYSTKSIQNYDSCVDTSMTINLRRGHPNSKFPLSIAQRDALSHVLLMSNADILAVNGPPGTGKTTLVLSVVASLWIKSALKDDEPMLIIAASTNNQAVLNILNAFAKDFDEGNDELSERWLPNVSSYGGYFPSASKEDEASGKYQTNSFYTNLESLEYLERAQLYFLQKAQNSFPKQNFESVSDVKNMILKQLKIYDNKLNHIQNCWNKYSKQKSLIKKLLGDEPEQQLERLKQNIESIQTSFTEMNSSLLTWRNYLAKEPIWLSLFSWLPFVLIKREVQRKNFIATSLCTSTQELKVLPDKLETTLEKSLALKEHSINQLHDTYLEYVQCYKLLKDLEFDWVSNIKEFLPEFKNVPTFDIIDPVLDTTLRFRMFRLSVHYWEARWLLACQEEGNNLEELSTKTGLKSVLPRWKRRMMITPCIVSTFHSLPSHMTHKKFDGEGEFNTEYLTNTIDLLIVDEAGQVSPDVAGASFSLAKKALVIGDIYQIEPIRKVTSSIDIGNLKQSNLISNNSDYKSIQSSGRSVVSGSVMQIAQKTSRYHYKKENEPGMYLQEHRRCYNELISYCNELCYGGLLLPKRGNANLNSTYPPFGYLNINGLSESFNGSRRNKLEAETIALWLISNRHKIEEYYGETLETTVGIVTPFAAQVEAITHACHTHGINTINGAEGLKIGTVHSLQGDERKIVIFSQVYTKHNNGSFIDMNNNMLNVAVSRAKDSFLVFGDMDVISGTHKSKPRGLLSKYLFGLDSNELSFNAGQRQDLLQICDQPKLLNNADEHDAFVNQLLDKVMEKIDIVSPWLIYQRLESTGILNKLKSAINRGVLINIYTDNHFNTTSSNRVDIKKQIAFEETCNVLKTLGINVNVINGIHSKIIFADDKYMTVGSFNWFSAAREGKYANVETSLVYVGDLTKEAKTHIEFLKKRTCKRYEAQCRSSIETE